MQISNILRIFVTGLLILVFSGFLAAQETFRKPLRRSQNQLELSGPYLKTLYIFNPEYYDTLQGSEPEPLLVAKYNDKDMIPAIFDAVFSQDIKVYSPNFWGSIPQLIEKAHYDLFDTLDILNYLSAGWDTSLVINNDGDIEQFPEYREIPFEEISGIFFFESWWLDQNTCKMYKDIAAYLPVREYLASSYEGYEDTEVRKRLLFMVIPEWSSGSKKSIKYSPKDFILVKQDLKYDVLLFNKPYEKYLYREEEYDQISQTEFDEWQYHHFDFYRYFDADIFLEKIVSAILDGKLHACIPGQSQSIIDRNEFLKILRNYPDEVDQPGWTDDGAVTLDLTNDDTDLLPENYPLHDLNSIQFHEDWYIHPGNLQIYKNIKSITINRHEIQLDNYTGDFLQEQVYPLFTVWF